MTAPPRPLLEQFSIWKRFRFRLEALGMRVLAEIVAPLPRGIMRWLARGIGGAGYYLLRQQRRIAMANLDIAFGESKTPSEKTAIARASFQNFAVTMLGQFWIPKFQREKLAEIAEVDPADLAFVRRIQARGQGVILITLHYGDWELLGLATSWYGIPMTVVSRTMRNAALEEEFRRLRAQSGNKIISSRGAGVALFKALKRGGSVALLIDQEVPRELGGVWVKFFGLPALTTSAPARLALRSGAAIVWSVAHPLPDGRCRIVYGPEISAAATGDEAADVRAISQRCLNYCEQIIRERPEYWLWSYKRWKHWPHDAPDGFPFYSSGTYPMTDNPPADPEG